MEDNSCTFLATGASVRRQTCSDCVDILWYDNVFLRVADECNLGSVVDVLQSLVLLQTVVETLIVCFCEDRHMNDGSRYNPYYMNSELFGLMIDALELAYKETQTQEDS